MGDVSWYSETLAFPEFVCEQPEFRVIDRTKLSPAHGGGTDRSVRTVDSTKVNDPFGHNSVSLLAASAVALGEPLYN